VLELSPKEIAYHQYRFSSYYNFGIVILVGMTNFQFQTFQALELSSGDKQQIDNSNV